MRLTRSLAVWLAATTAGVLGAHGWLAVVDERHDLVTAARREVALLTTAIRGAVENALRDEQGVDVHSLLEQLEVEDPDVDVFLFDDDGSLIAGSRGSEGNLARAQALARGARAPVSVEDAVEDGLMAAVPLRTGGSMVGRLVVVRPPDRLRADIDAESRAVVISIVLLIGALSLVSWLVLRQRLHRPMSHLVAGIRRLACGDLSSRIAMAGRDEISEIAREFDLMAEALDEARARLAAETEKHERLELDLQHANRIATVGVLSAMLAHEIGSPLQVLNGRARMLAARAELPEDARHSARILVEQTDRIDRIVQRLLGIARRKSPVFEKLDLRVPVRMVIEMLSSEARRQGVTIETAFDDVPNVRADGDHVQQVVLNLLQNALRASRPGSVVRIAITPSSFARSSVTAEIPAVSIVVEDMGDGIDDAVRERVFQPFFSGWTNQGRGGTGLGLAVVKSIMNEHGGVVVASTRASGSGASFRVHFPVHIRAAAQEGAT